MTFPSPEEIRAQDKRNRDKSTFAETLITIAMFPCLVLIFWILTLFLGTF